MQFNYRYKLWLLLEAESPLSVGSGREGLTSDRLVACNANGFPFIPGTGLAGALRAGLSKSLLKDEIESLSKEEAESLLKVKIKKILKEETESLSKEEAESFLKAKIKEILKEEIESLPKEEAESLLKAKIKELSEKEIESLFGFAIGNQGLGSRLIVNSAHLLAESGTAVLEGLTEVGIDSEFYRHLIALPVRDHARLDDRGTAVDKGKFDEQICYKGTRFVGTLELLGNENDKKVWDNIIIQLASPMFRIGGGARKGFGKIKIEKMKKRVYDLSKIEDLKDYLLEDNSLAEPMDPKWKTENSTSNNLNKFIHYQLTLTPRDFFIFGSGYGDDEADEVFKTEKTICWNTGRGIPTDEHILLPASSIKGAFRHRLAFHYNNESENHVNTDPNKQNKLLIEKLLKLEEFAKIPENANSDDSIWEETLKNLDEITFDTIDNSNRSERNTDNTSQNKAVQELFGYAADHSATSDDKGKKGNIFLSDIYLDKRNYPEKVFDHVKIDRYTGGASEGALFQEKTVFNNNQSFVLNMYVNEDSLSTSAIKNAWHNTLLDLCEGRLPLGGRTTKGHGYFTGTCNVNLKTETVK